MTSSSYSLFWINEEYCWYDMNSKHQYNEAKWSSEQKKDYSQICDHNFSITIYCFIQYSIAFIYSTFFDLFSYCPSWLRPFICQCRWDHLEKYNAFDRHLNGEFEEEYRVNMWRTTLCLVRVDPVIHKERAIWMFVLSITCHIKAMCAICIIIVSRISVNLNK